MQTRVTVEEIYAAARQLATSQDGRAGLRHLLDVLHDDSVRHGLLDRTALTTLLQAAWEGHATEVREAIRDGLGDS